MIWKPNTPLPDRTLIGKVWRTFDGKVLATIDGRTGLAMELPMPDALTWGTVRLDELKPGDKLQVDETFTCIPSQSIVEVKYDAAEAYRDKEPTAGLYVECQTFKHFLVGQLDADGYLTGMRRPTP